MSDLLAPGFFVAVPQLLDPNFRHSVVLLLEQNDEGALGVVVNQESDLLLQELCNDHQLPYAGDPTKRVRQGGPVQKEQGIVLYGNEHQDPAGRPVIEGLNISASRETLSRLCSMPSGRFHCYSGYAGWGPGQLEGEIEDGSWLMVTPTAGLVLDTPPGEIWDRALRSAGIDPAVIVPGGGVES